jgi:hypothetical protein
MFAFAASKPPKAVKWVNQMGLSLIVSLGFFYCYYLICWD